MYVWRVPLSSIHTVGLKHLGDDHPEARAVYYESEVYNKRKIKDLLSALRGLRVRSHCAAPPPPPAPRHSPQCGFYGFLQHAVTIRQQFLEPAADGSAAGMQVCVVWRMCLCGYVCARLPVHHSLPTFPATPPAAFQFAVSVADGSARGRLPRH